MTTDILENLVQIREAFRRSGLAAPAAVLLKSHEDGMYFMNAIAQGSLTYVIGENGTCPSVTMPDGSVWMSFTYAGVEVRFPAERYELLNGKTVFG